MKIHNPEKYNIQLVIVENIIKTSRIKNLSLKESSLIVFNIARKKHKKIGFNLQCFEKFYSSVRKFKSNLNRIPLENEYFTT